jgi:hypothetical protein
MAMIPTMMNRSVKALRPPIGIAASALNGPSAPNVVVMIIPKKAANAGAGAAADVVAVTTSRRNFQLTVN